MIDEAKLLKHLTPTQIDNLLFGFYQAGVRFAARDTAFHHAVVRKWFDALLVATQEYEKEQEDSSKLDGINTDPTGPGSRLTTDREHPRLTHGSDDAPRPQAEVYLVLSPEELQKGYLKPLRNRYRHKICGAVTTMGFELSATYARDPWFYGGTYCVTCAMHRPLIEFTWEPDGESMDPIEWSEVEMERVAALRSKED